MGIKTKIYEFGVVKAVLIFLVVLFTALYTFKDRIKEHKVTKAKMEMFKRMTETKPDQWDDEFRQIYDSMIVRQVDTTMTN